MSAQDLSSSIAEAVAEAWGTLFCKSVALSPSADMAELSSTDLPTEGTHVQCDIHFSGDITGQARYLVAKSEALTMVGMMMSMGADDALVESTRAGELGADELDGLKEAFNQLSSTAATILRDQCSCSVSAELGALEVVELDEAPATGFGDDDQALPFTLSLEGFDDGTLIQILDADLFQALETGGSADSAHEMEDSSTSADSSKVNLDAIADLTVSADLILAERTMDFKNLLNLAVGSVIEFWKPCDHPADLCIQNTPIANGEVVLCSNQHFGLRVLNLAPNRQTYQKGAH